MDARDQRSSSWNALFVVATAACLCLAGVGLTASAQPAAEAGVWQPHRLTFNYVGIQPVYSCEGLREDMQFLLRQSGAQVNSVTPLSCFRSAGAPNSLISAQLNFSTLQPGTAEGDASGTMGVWRHVEFSNTRSNPQLRGADCELVQEFKTQVLPQLNTRNVQSYLPCVPYQTTGFQWSLSFDSFVPATAGHREVGGAD